MLSNAQKSLLKQLQRQAKLPDADYRDLIAKVTGWADCRSSTDGRLDQGHMDKLKAELLVLAQPANLGAQLKQQDMPRRRLEHRLSEIQACLGLYVDDVARYVATVMADKFKVPAEGTLTIDDLSEQRPIFRRRDGTTFEGSSQLEQLVMTLWARVQPMRRAAKHSLHDMCCLADVPCDCRQCNPPGVLLIGDGNENAVPSGTAEEGEPF